MILDFETLKERRIELALNLVKKTFKKSNSEAFFFTQQINTYINQRNQELFHANYDNTEIMKNSPVIYIFKTC